MKRMTLLGLAITAIPASVLAQTDNGWSNGYGSMMGGGWGGGWAGGIFGGFMMLAFWGVIIALIVFAVRGISGNRGGDSRKDALDTLRERFAAGEIDEEEYNRRKRVLEN